MEELAEDAVVIRMVVKTSPGDHWSASRELRERIKDAFDEAGIEIPFAQRTVWLRAADEKSVAAVGGGSATDHADSNSGDSDSTTDGDFDGSANEGDGDDGNGEFGNYEKS